MDSLSRRALLCALLSVAWPSASWACSVCGCGDPLVAVSDARPSTGQVRLSLGVETLSVAARNDEDPRFFDELFQVALRPVFALSPRDDVTISVQVPLLRKDFQTRTPGFPPLRSLRTGLGDVDLNARLFVLRALSFERQDRQEVALVAGSTLPTGVNDALGENGVRLEEHAQLGAGAAAPYGKVTWAYHRDPWNAAASATVRVPMTNRYGYRYGVSAQWALHGQYRAVERLALGIGLDGRYAARDGHGGGVVNGQSGGLVLAATPAVKLQIAGELWAYASVQLPFLARLNGEQRVGPVANAGMQFVIP